RKDDAMRLGLLLLLCLIASGVVAQTGSDSQDESETLWSLRTLRTEGAPATESSWTRAPLDSFVFEKLHEKQLTPSAEADRRVLIRRLTYDLVGLPPTPEELAEFQADQSPDA